MTVVRLLAILGELQSSGLDSMTD